jgi:hypothetical protein
MLCCEANGAYRARTIGKGRVAPREDNGFAYENSL